MTFPSVIGAIPFPNTFLNHQISKPFFDQILIWSPNLFSAPTAFSVPRSDGFGGNFFFLTTITSELPYCTTSNCSHIGYSDKRIVFLTSNVRILFFVHSHAYK